MFHLLCLVVDESTSTPPHQNPLDRTSSLHAFDPHIPTMSVPLPLYLSLEDVQDPTGFTMRALWNAWRIDMEGIDQRTEAYKEVVDFTAK